LLAPRTAAVQFIAIGISEKHSLSCNLDLKLISDVTINAGKRVFALVITEVVAKNELSLGLS